MACTQLVVVKQLVILFKMAAANGHDCVVDLYTRNPLMCVILLRSMRAEGLWGTFHDQGDAKWIVIRRELRGHNNTPFGKPIPGRPIGRPGVGRPQGIFDVSNYY
jgi:hypothetical protein